VVAIIIAVGGFALVMRDVQSERLAAAVEQDREGGLDEVLDQAGVSAERFCVFGPYATRQQIDDALGFSWPPASDTGIGLTDTQELVVAADSNRVVAWAMVSLGTAADLVGGDYRCEQLA